MSKERQFGEYESIVRRALRLLSDTGKKKSPINLEKFSLVNGKTDLFPVDGDNPADDSLSGYLNKLMEYTETFLVASRLGKDMDIKLVLPPRFDPSKYIEAILTELRGETANEENSQLRYYPMPHLQINHGEPFVDFAGFLSVILLDFLKWTGNTSSGLGKSAQLELDNAIGFILDKTTYIEDENGIGWAFVRGEKCAQKAGKSLNAYRHGLPTAWSIVALHEYIDNKGANPELSKQAIQIMPEVLKWTKELTTHEGLFKASEGHLFANLASHNYVTETLLTISNRLPDSEAPKLAEEALRRYVEELDRPDARRRFEQNTAYDISIEDKLLCYYSDHTTWATCLSTLALGVDFLSGKDPELQLRARDHCNSMAKHIAIERMDENGLWQRGSFQFHWTLNAVEALMRYGRFAQTKTYSTSDDAIAIAITKALHTEKVIQALQEATQEALKISSRDLTLSED